MYKNFKSKLEHAVDFLTHVQDLFEPLPSNPRAQWE